MSAKQENTCYSRDVITYGALVQMINHLTIVTLYKQSENFGFYLCSLQAQFALITHLNMNVCTPVLCTTFFKVGVLRDYRT
jgi:hypothetical protein